MFVARVVFVVTAWSEKLTSEQRNLFRMPRPKKIVLTQRQRELLAWIDYTNEKPSAWPRRFQKRTLLILMAKQVVDCTNGWPVIYKVTGLGRAVLAREKRSAPRPGMWLTGKAVPQEANE